MIRRNKQIEKETIENAFVLRALKYDVSAVKFTDPSSTGAPDRICLCPDKHTFFIEFKKPGGVLSKNQELYHKKLRKLGYSVYVHDSVDDAVRSLIIELRIHTYVDC